MRIFLLCLKNQCRIILVFFGNIMKDKKLTFYIKPPNLRRQVISSCGDHTILCPRAPFYNMVLHMDKQLRRL